ncbi:MAG: ParB N-terminal domain-containing protein [Pirellulales bacterium]
MTIDPEFEGLCPELSPEEQSLLEASIEADGCRDKIIVWANHDDTILDGHNRYRICRQFGFKFETKALTFETREEVVNWIINNQLGRRNLTKEQRTYLLGKRYNTAEKHAKNEGVSAASIKRAGKFADDLDVIETAAGPEAKREILAGKSGLTKREISVAAQLPATEIKERLEAKRTKAGTAAAKKRKKRFSILHERAVLFHWLRSIVRQWPPKYHDVLLQDIRVVLSQHGLKCELIVSTPPARNDQEKE